MLSRIRARTASWLPPRPTIAAATAMAVPVIALVAAAQLLAGDAVALGVFLGALSGVSAALTSVGARARATIGALAVLGAVAGDLVADRTWLLAVLLLALALGQAPLNRVSVGIGALLLVPPAVTASVGTADAAGSTGVGVALGFAAVVGIGRALPGAATPAPVAPAVAWRHAVTLGLAAAASAPVLTAGFGHGYWLVLTLAAALRPLAQETVRGAVGRGLGSIVGVALAATVVLVLPPLVAVLAAGVLAIGNLSWTLAGDAFKQTVLGTPVVILVASSSPAGSQAHASAERLLLVGAGAALALVAAAALAWLDARARGLSGAER